MKYRGVLEETAMGWGDNANALVCQYRGRKLPRARAVLAVISSKQFSLYLSHETGFVFITKTNRLMLFREIRGISQNRTKHMKTLCGHSRVFIYFHNVSDYRRDLNQ
jgi:hypothetical protein